MTIEMYTTPSCPYCDHAKNLLKQYQLDFEEINVSDNQAKMLEMVKRSGRRTVPQIFIGGESIGGYDELSQMDLLPGLTAHSD